MCHDNIEIRAALPASAFADATPSWGDRTVPPPTRITGFSALNREVEINLISVKSHERIELVLISLY